jgi:hypothetical protein
MILRLVLLALFILYATTYVFAADPSADDLRAKAQNPVSSMYSLPLKLTLDFGAPDDEAVFFTVNPVIPVTVGDWNLVIFLKVPPAKTVKQVLEI